MPTDAALLRLLQLASPALPVGAYAYSQGLEYAVESSWVKDEAGALAWIGGVLGDVLAWTDLPMLARLHMAWSAQDAAAAGAWNARLYALRETAELRAEDHQLGSALARVLHDLGIAAAGDWLEARPVCFATLFALAAVQWNIAPREAMLGYAWAWVENQVTAAIKLVPLGQAAGQRLLSAVQPALTRAVDTGLAVSDDDIGRSMPGMVMASAKHAQMYSRLFRS
ncbi:urease accessory protein UreF [Acidihalobacter ferrooxydans]|uniref:Urease accessory protein UreF n=1 Tax=Acidihalobacter ferrooxydans TaxID=1765967 RepID=A0A1P8UDB2_9GAMM|nr:urease accessory UreF family protein [Acidihalobacter ferrooxydans]APZ41774.1 urease accessory protein UreF [Acidihalobacter ferrooxydans]